MKIFDCFPFNNELDVLEVRLHEMYPVVDHFVIVEANRTHRGNPKPFHFLENHSRFAEFGDKIIHIRVDDLPNTDNPWVRERFQRDCIVRGLSTLRQDDLVLICDVDEILRREVVASLRNDRRQLFGFRLPLFFYRFNYVRVAGECVHHVTSVGLRGRRFRSAQAARDLRHMEGFRNWVRVRRQDGLILSQAGWHFSWLGNEANIIQKLLNNAPHGDPSDPELMPALNIGRMLASRSDHSAQAGTAWAIVELDDYFPRHVLENRSRFSRLIAPDATGYMCDFQSLLRWEAHPVSRFCKVGAHKLKGLLPRA